MAGPTIDFSILKSGYVQPRLGAINAPPPLFPVAPNYNAGQSYSGSIPAAGVSLQNLFQANGIISFSGFQYQYVSQLLMIGIDNQDIVNGIVLLISNKIWKRIAPGAYFEEDGIMLQSAICSVKSSTNAPVSSCDIRALCIASAE